MIIAIIVLFSIVAIGCLMASKFTVSDEPKISKYIQTKYPDIVISKIEYVPRSADGTIYGPVGNTQGRRYKVIGVQDGRDIVIKVQIHGLQGVYERDF